jgi:hypothetical protein
MSHMLDSHYLFGLSPAILKHRSLSLLLLLSQLSVKTLVFCSPRYLRSLPHEIPHSRDLHVLAPRLARGINTIFCTPRPFDRPSVATEIAWYRNQIDKPVPSPFLLFLTGHTGLCKGRDQSAFQPKEWYLGRSIFRTSRSFSQSSTCGVSF